VALVYRVTDVSPGARESAQYTLLGWFVRQSLRRFEEFASVCEYPAIPWREIPSFDIRALLPPLLPLYACAGAHTSPHPKLLHNSIVDLNWITAVVERWLMGW